jgi:hypothetical protein
VYRIKHNQYEVGSQCANSTMKDNRTMCRVHRRFEGALPEYIPDNSFPRIYTSFEERAWVTEARRCTDPNQNIRGACVICGQLREKKDLRKVTKMDLCNMRPMLKSDPLYSKVPASYFQYGTGLEELAGLVLDKNGLFRTGERVRDHDVVGTNCIQCWQTISKERIPKQALANGHWTGVGQVKELRDLTWIEEKLIARTHVSIQLQKCRILRNWRWDRFYPQSRIKGHIVTYPMNPTGILLKLPLGLDRVSEVVKVVFLSKKRVSFATAQRLSFFIVRRSKVLKALQWLIAHNPLYVDTEIDQAAIDELPDDGLPEKVYNMITFSNRVTEDMMQHSRYDDPDEAGITKNLSSWTGISDDRR